MNDSKQSENKRLNILKDKTPNSTVSKYSAVVFTAEPEEKNSSIEKSKEKTKSIKDKSEEDYEDFEDDFEPYETSNEDQEEKKTEKTNPTNKTASQKNQGQVNIPITVTRQSIENTKSSYRSKLPTSIHKASVDNN